MRGPEDTAAGGGFAGSLERVTGAAALAGGVLLLLVMIMTVISIAGRWLFSAPIPGDYEITELVSGVAVFAFFPYCHINRGNIVVEFFTARLPARGQLALDVFHNFAFIFVAGLITWRLIVGGLHKRADGEHTWFLEIPIHWAYFPAACGAVLLVVVCIHVFVTDLRTLRR